MGVGLAAFVADRDSRNRLRIEQAVERTAVGDRLFFPVEGSPALHFEGQPLVLAGAPEVRPESGMLLTGTGIVPPNDFTLAADDRVIIEIDGIGRLENHVAVV